MLLVLFIGWLYAGAQSSKHLCQIQYNNINLL